MRLMRLTCGNPATSGDPILVNPLTVTTAYHRDGKTYLSVTGGSEPVVLENLNAVDFEFNAAMNEPLSARGGTQ
jgi:hypothetical protein